MLKQFILTLERKGWFISSYPRNGNKSIVIGLGRNMCEIDFSFKPICIDVFYNMKHWRFHPYGRSWRA